MVEQRGVEQSHPLLVFRCPQRQFHPRDLIVQPQIEEADGVAVLLIPQRLISRVGAQERPRKCPKDGTAFTGAQHMPEQFSVAGNRHAVAGAFRQHQSRTASALDLLQGADRQPQRMNDLGGAGGAGVRAEREPVSCRQRPQPLQRGQQSALVVDEAFAQALGNRRLRHVPQPEVAVQQRHHRVLGIIATKFGGQHGQPVQFADAAQHRQQLAAHLVLPAGVGLVALHQTLGRGLKLGGAFQPGRDRIAVADGRPAKIEHVAGGGCVAVHINV